jgi:5-methylthioadenosine/S-adenosylhomocysteine deaminase
MRSILGHGIIDFPAPGVPDPAKNIEEAVAFVERWQHKTPLIRPALFCHSPYTCSHATLVAAKNAAREHGVLFQIHAAETRREADTIVSANGTSPVGYLDRLGILDPDTQLVHAVWIDADDIKTIAERRTRVVHNPESNMKLASGISPVPALLDSDVVVGLGTDGCASNNDMDLFREMDTAAKLHKADRLDPTVMNARTVLEMATVNGARACGLGDVTGSLVAGKQADLIIIDPGTPGLTPLYAPVSQIVYSIDGSSVRDVMVAGRWLVRDRRLLTLDLEAVMEKIEKIGNRIKHQMTERKSR